VLLELVCPVAPEPPKPTTVTAAGQALPTTPTQGRTLQGNVLDLKDVDIGTVVKVKGGLGAYRGVPQLLLERIGLRQEAFSGPNPLTHPPAILPTTTAEATAWHSLATFHSTILSRPWLLSATDERRLRASADKAARATRRPASAEVPRPARHVAGAAVVAEGARLDARTARGAVDRDTGGKQNTRPALVRVRDEARARDGVAGQTRGDDGAGPAGARVRVRAGVVGSGGEGRVGVRFIKRAEAALLGGERGGKGREG
jgi:hypothetical protein